MGEFLGQTLRNPWLPAVLRGFWEFFELNQGLGLILGYFGLFAKNLFGLFGWCIQNLFGWCIQNLFGWKSPQPFNFLGS